jgi:hypothetical protein
MKRLIVGLAAVVVLSISMPLSVCAEILGRYYLTGPTGPDLESKNYVLQGSDVLSSWDQEVNGEFAIAVFGDPVNRVRTLTNGPTSPSSGSEYTLDGVFTGTSYTHPVPYIPNTDLFDATTDGTYIYSWDTTNGRAYRFDDDWTNPVTLFEISTNDDEDYFLGITYDGANDSLWLSGYKGIYGNTVENRTLDGTLLSSFTVSHDKNTALALDVTDDSLWLFDRNTWFTTPTFEQYSKDGTLLSSVAFPDLTGRNFLGGEIVSIPEPSILVKLDGLIVMGLVGYGWRRRKR